MTAKKINARPKALKQSIRGLIARRAIDNPTVDRKYLANEIIKEIVEVGDTPPSEETCIKYISDARSKYTEDAPWNSATLRDNPIDPIALPSILYTQNLLKKYLSKPITIREAKWLGRFCGMIDKLPVMDIYDTETNRNAHAFTIYTWAHLFSRREIIDTIGNNKNPDYSDLDEALSSNDLTLILSSETKRYFSEFAAILRSKNSTQELKLMEEIRMSPEMRKHSLKYPISESSLGVEFRCLGFSLGIPNMPEDALALYLLTWEQHFDEELMEKLDNMHLKQQINFILNLRKKCRDDYKLYNNHILDSEELEKLFKDGE